MASIEYERGNINEAKQFIQTVRKLKYNELLEKEFVKIEGQINKSSFTRPPIPATPYTQTLDAILWRHLADTNINIIRLVVFFLSLILSFLSFATIAQQDSIDVFIANQMKQQGLLDYQ